MNYRILKGKEVLVTGGLGFVGSNLAIELVKQGAKVTVVDNLTPQQGGNLFNIDPIKNNITINFSDIRDRLAIAQLVQGKEYIFHLARQTDHILSQTDPFPDIDVNIRGTTIILEACKHYNPRVRFIYIGTRGQYGHAVKLPVSESAPTNPKGMYEITNLAAEKIIGIYNDIHGIPAIMLRLTNIYGPRSQMKHDHYGIVNWFIRLAMEGKTIPIFGDGTLKRDILYIYDATDAIMACATNKRCYGEIINVGKPHPETLAALVKTIVGVAKRGSYTFTEFTKERAAQEPGDFASDITKITSLTGWKPKTTLEAGIRKTVKYYKKHKSHYW
ncbi:NAD-dependent dehydratase [Candidatus Gottesmanbacteria bacterium RBG_13_45_10]|uniref:NAD-dependent dehydratase n=1 Tax=Candidatus Gottesmanbacteria bacterium RBG_13_45_10 TaxID=1798370 RepID=A0A1F5ZHY1_9BACT|nr:MAG: NAD-dependent dehydratase [Candidatus Gottesmanbacteria bacterium RBG_13_45_10]